MGIIHRFRPSDWVHPKWAGDDISATLAGTSSDSGTITLVGASDFPNEPAGLVTQIDSPLNDYMPESCEAGVSPGTVTGWDGRYGNQHGYADSPQGNIAGCSQQNFTVDTSTSTPKSNGWHRTKFPDGLTAGTTPGKWDSLGEGQDTLDVVYTAIFHRFVDPGDGTLQGPANIKHGFWGVGNFGAGNDNVGNEVYVRLKPDADPASAFGFELVQQNQVSRTLNRNLATPTVSVGTWNRQEYLFNLNDVGSANGRARAWLSTWNGSSWTTPTQSMDHTDVEWRTSGKPEGFKGFKWDPTWGGDDKVGDEHVDVAYIYQSGSVI